MMRKFTPCLILATWLALPAVASAQIPANMPSTLPSTLQPAQMPAGRGNTTTTVKTNNEPVVTRTSTADDKRIAASQRAPEVLVEPPMTFSKLEALKKQAQKAVFIVRAYQDPAHKLATTGVSFDGACVALVRCPDSVDLPDAGDVAAPEPQSNPSSFFGRGLDRATSPFARQTGEPDLPPQNAICYLTTADWLTNSTKIEIIVHNKHVAANVAMRDEAQNVVVLQSAPVPGVQGLEVAPYDAPQTPFAYALINPGQTFENFSEQSFVIDMPHRYGLTSLAARNGYPLINAHAQIVGLTVAQTTDRTRSTVVHYGLIDRALNPEKYDRTVNEKTEFTRY